MKKSILLAALLVVSAANAQETQFKWGGSLGLRYETVENRELTEEGHYSDFTQTTKLHVDVVKSESLMGKITLRNVALWGNTDGFTGSETAYKSENVNDNILLVEEAYAVWKVSDAGALQFGRGSFELNNGELVSKNGDGGVVPISFDGILYTHDFEPVRVGVFGVRAVDDGFNYSEHGYTKATDRGEGHFFGATFEVKTLPEFLNKLNLHYIGAKTNANDKVATPAISKNERTWIGLSTTGETGPVDYGFAYENFEGEAGTLDREGDMFNLTAGFNMPEVKALRIGASYHQSSGDKNGALADGKSNAYDSFNYDQKRYTGRMGLIRWGNGRSTTNALLGTGLEAIGVHFKIEPTEGLKVFADYFMFTAAEKQTNSEDELGQELDLGVEKSYANGLKTTLEYGMFTAGDRFGTAGKDATRVAASIGFDF